MARSKRDQESDKDSEGSDLEASELWPFLPFGSIPIYKPEPPVRGNDDARTLYESIGRALSAWELLEEALSDVFAFFVAGEQEVDYISPAVRAYGSIVGFTGRKDMLDAAAKAFFHKLQNDACATEYHEIMKVVAAYAPRRNEIAHGIVSQPADDEWFLLPPHYMSKKNPILEPPTYKYTAKEIGHLMGMFGYAQHVLASFCHRLRTNAPPRP